jgi:hypothetical protein
MFKKHGGKKCEEDNRNDWKSRVYNPRIYENNTCNADDDDDGNDKKQMR